jgi:hypothetical protein
MTLYGLSEQDVAQVVGKGERTVDTEACRMVFTHDLAPKFKHPIKVVGLEQGRDLLVVTAYPLKKGKF